MRPQLATISLFSLCLTLAVANEAFAASAQTITNPVPNGYMKIDGSLSDWMWLNQYAADNTGDGSTGAFPAIDILQGAVAHDANNFYFLYRNAGDNMVTTASNWIFIDLDQNKATGLAAAGGINFSVGAEYNLGGVTGWNGWGAAGNHLGTGAGWTMAPGDSNGSGVNDFIEWSISRTAIQPGGGTFNPTGTSFDLIFVAENTATPDYSPNNGATDWFTYNATGVYNPGVAGDANGDGFITMADYALIQANSFTAVKFGTMGDVDDNGFVDFEDFNQWKANFPGGPAAAEAAIAALPEPASMGLATLAMGVLFMVRRGRES